MSYTALYRKFRPDNFDDVKGQDHIVTTLTNQIKANRIGHAYLFCGTRGTGKTTVAKILAKAVNCEHPVNGSPCNECAMCKAIQAGTAMNVIEIDAASNNGVDNIREIREEVSYRPTEGKYKVYIIDEVHMMTTGAFNALLKTIEEPPEYAVILLITENSKNLLDTIQSRCITLNTRPLTKAEIKEYLIKNLQMDEDQADIAAAFCQGNVGKAIHFSSDQNFQEMKAETLSLLKQIDKMDVPEIMQQIKSFSQRKSSMDDYLDLMLLWYRDVLMFKITKDTNILLYREEYKAISEQACIHNYQKIENIIKAIDNAKVRLAANVNFDITIELLLLTIKEN